MSSNAASSLCTLSISICIIAGLANAPPLSAQDDAGVTPEDEAASLEAAQKSADNAPDPINILVTVPRGDVNQAQVQECEDSADAATISGDIIVCRQLGESGDNYFSGSRANAQRRYAEETAFRNAPRAPEAFGIPNHGSSIGFGSVPPPALIIDVEALPEAPEGSDADRIARGLPPLGQEELTEEEEKARREALGLPTP